MKKHKNNHFRLDLSNIIKRLPLLRQINASQAAIISFTPAWKNWASNNLPESFQTSCTLNSFNEGVLSISCSTPIAASQLKHQQMSILQAFYNSDHHQILSIKIQIDHQLTSSSSLENTNNINSKINTDTPTSTTREALSTQAINNINNCQKSVKNERLRDSLKRLSETLKERN